jgi:hypothetical protein
VLLGKNDPWWHRVWKKALLVKGKAEGPKGWRPEWRCRPEWQSSEKRVLMSEHACVTTVTTWKNMIEHDRTR